jgi:Photosystem II reaction centre N protein (psbN)
MEIILSIILTGIAFGLLIFALYESFGPNSKQLRDPFEEHED